jgi:hypothetical protein
MSGAISLANNLERGISPILDANDASRPRGERTKKRRLAPTGTRCPK